MNGFYERWMSEHRSVYMSTYQICHCAVWTLVIPLPLVFMANNKESFLTTRPEAVVSGLLWLLCCVCVCVGGWWWWKGGLNNILLLKKHVTKLVM